MDEQKIYELLGSANPDRENEGLSLLIQHKGFLMRKHRFPNHFNDEDRDDIFYKGLMILFERIQQGRFVFEKASIEKFLYRTFENIIRRKRKVPNETSNDNMAQMNIIADKSKLFDTEILDQISRIFRIKLGETCQRILVMRYYEGMKQKEIAEEMSLALGTVKNNSSRCINELQRLIEETPHLGAYLKGLLKDES